MSRVALFPGSFDPFTRGHADIVRQALFLFDSVVIAIGRNEAKHSFLSIDNRRRLIEDLYASEPRIKVEIYDTLTTDLAKNIGAVAIIRGVRSTVDFEYERTMATVNRRLDDSVATIMLFAAPDSADISSSVVRELYSFGHSVDDFMPDSVDIENYIEQR